jgi:hypothetical protein
MDAYVFGRHDGDLPTHLVGNGEPGNRIRAMARLNEGEHDVFYALEVGSIEDLERHVGDLQSAGSTPSVVLRPDGGWSAVDLKIPPLPQPPVPMWMPPYPVLCLIIAEIDDVGRAVETLVEHLGPEGIAIWRGENGDYLVEAGADDRQKLEAALQAATEPEGFVERSRLLTSGDDMVRA